MAKNQMTTEYVVPGSKELSFEANPAAALQCLVGGLLPAQPPTGSGLGSKGRKLETDAAPDSPKGLTTDIEQHVSGFRNSLDTWRKLTRRLMADRLTPDGGTFVRELLETREILERNCLNLTVALIPANKALVLCACGISGQPYHRYLGLPAPVSDDQLCVRAREWGKALIETQAFDHPKDPDFPRLLARVDYLADEMLESLKEITREAMWLLTNEPTADRIGALLEWLHDLRCECTEIVPPLTCLETPLIACLACIQTKAEEEIPGAPDTESIAAVTETDALPQ